MSLPQLQQPVAAVSAVPLPSQTDRPESSVAAADTCPPETYINDGNNSTEMRPENEVQPRAVGDREVSYGEILKSGGVKAIGESAKAVYWFAKSFASTVASATASGFVAGANGAWHGASNPKAVIARSFDGVADVYTSSGNVIEHMVTRKASTIIDQAQQKHNSGEQPLAQIILSGGVRSMDELSAVVLQARDSLTEVQGELMDSEDAEEDTVSARKRKVTDTAEEDVPAAKRNDSGDVSDGIESGSNADKNLETLQQTMVEDCAKCESCKELFCHAMQQARCNHTLCISCALMSHNLQGCCVKCKAYNDYMIEVPQLSSLANIVRKGEDCGHTLCQSKRLADYKNKLTKKGAERFCDKILSGNL